MGRGGKAETAGATKPRFSEPPRNYPIEVTDYPLMKGFYHELRSTESCIRATTAD